ncbi:homocysteine S-methyltransferase [Nakamurella panacisegetis]|uniref:Homocysteine S-methyltransferase n=1 Tax=Nakamurella panacisegetis TaxID=1090615 RepID=A0A1H0INT8_9ACTN|nr:homocysteine S-methyltransferase [Nakamurella panacisegetis]SDO33174.1 homocysteine S-methyltransferase [Nakamurella panacisegetis]
MTTLPQAVAAGPVVLDGGLATLLEARGNDLTSDLWSARLLLDDPDEIVAAHREYFQAGAQVAITGSYQASYEGFARLGLSRAESEAALLASVACAVRARDQFDDGSPRWVAASIGPYGAVLADGSEYRGDYGRTATELYEWHRPRFEVLARSGADVLAFETVPAMVEVEAIVRLLDGTGLRAWISLTAEDGRTRAGEPIEDAFALAASIPEVFAVGVNCCPAPQVAGLAAAASATGKSVVVYPNSGEVWDGVTRSWSGDPTFTATEVESWTAAGASLIGGCCRVGPAQISALASALRN